MFKSKSEAAIVILLCLSVPFVSIAAAKMIPAQQAEVVNAKR